MKNSNFIIILLALALLFTAYKWIASASATDCDNIESSTISDILTRTSVRSFTDKAIEQDKIDTLLMAAMAAPTAGNKQPWRFVVVDDKATLKSISNNFHTMSMAKDAALAVIMCGDTTATFSGEGRDYWIQDVSAASENLLLAAHAMGLGAVWCGIYPLISRVEQFSAMLNLPPHIIPMACICVGYPEGETTPKDKWKPEYIHYNIWDTLSTNLPQPEK